MSELIERILPGRTQRIITAIVVALVSMTAGLAFMARGDGVAGAGEVPEKLTVDLVDCTTASDGKQRVITHHADYPPTPPGVALEPVTPDAALQRYAESIDRPVDVEQLRLRGERGPIRDYEQVRDDRVVRVVRVKAIAPEVWFPTGAVVCAEEETR